MMSCGGTSHVTTRNDTLTMVSIGHGIRTSPGPLSWDKRCPRRNTTPRSYSRRMLRHLAIQRAMIAVATKMIGSIALMVMRSPGGDQGSRVRSRRVAPSVPSFEDLREESETTFVRWRRAERRSVCAGGDRRYSGMQAPYLLASLATTSVQECVDHDTTERFAGAIGQRRQPRAV